MRWVASPPFPPLPRPCPARGPSTAFRVSLISPIPSYSFPCTVSPASSPPLPSQSHLTWLHTHPSPPPLHLNLNLNLPPSPPLPNLPSRVFILNPPPPPCPLALHFPIKALYAMAVKLGPLLDYGSAALLSAGDPGRISARAAAALETCKSDRIAEVRRWAVAGLAVLGELKVRD